LPHRLQLVGGDGGRAGADGDRGLAAGVTRDFGFASTAKDVATGVVANHLTAIVIGAKLFCPFC
jgi:hypothetical protein